jgi:hypothetical protein
MISGVSVVQLKRDYKINHDGTTDSGPLIADEKGIGVEVRTKTKEKTSFLKVKVLVKRHYLVFWDQVTGYEISRPAPKALGGSTVNSNDVTFTVRTMTNQHSFLLHLTSESKLRNELGPYLARVDNR